MSLADIALIKPVARVALDTLDVSGAPVAALQTPTITPQPGGNPGGGIFMAQSDVLAITAMSNTAGLQVIVTGRMVNLQGGSLPFQYPLTLPNAYTAYSITPNLGGGYLQSLVLTPAAPLAAGQQIYATAGLQSPGLSIGTPYAMLYGGYIGNTWQSGWPGGIFQKPTDGPGCLIAGHYGTGSGSGNPPDVDIPTNAVWEVMSIHVDLIGDGVAASRGVIYEFYSGQGGDQWELLEISTESTQAATQGAQFTCGPGGAPSTYFSLFNYAAGPSPIRLNGGGVMRILLQRDAGDTYNLANYLVREWLVLA